MVRIQKIKASPTETTLSVEGRIVSEWVAVLEHECRQALRDTRRVQLDLAAVTFIDTRGVEVLRCLVTEGVAIVNCREFIDALLTGDQDAVSDAANRGPIDVARGLFDVGRSAMRPGAPPRSAGQEAREPPVIAILSRRNAWLARIGLLSRGPYRESS